jgi:hypothetical protein
MGGHSIYILLATLAGILGLVCWIVILIDAFQTSLLKGLLFFFCGCYAIYYALVDFQHENKLLIVIGFLGSGSISAAFLQLAR